VDKSPAVKQEKMAEKESGGKGVKMEGIGKTAKDEDENTTEQSSSQHLSYVTGEYQLDNYDIFSRRKNVKFQEKIEEAEKHEHHRGSSKGSSRNSSILKNSSRVLDRSLASVHLSSHLDIKINLSTKFLFGYS
jgi:hypothetical protein